MLFDASASVNLCGEKKLDQILAGCTIDLTTYEIGNAVWKQVYIHKKITLEEANTVLDSLIDILRNLKKVEIDDFLEVLKIAVKEGIDCYDASLPICGA